MTTLATVADVKRVLRKQDDEDIDTLLEPKLEEAAEWIKLTTGIDWDATANVTKVYVDIRNDGIIELPDRAPTLVSVTADGLELDSTQYELLDGGMLVMRAPLFDIDAIGAYVKSRPYTWRKVTVVFTPSAVVSRILREATATLAASRYLQEEQGAPFITSESLGDYSYSIDSKFDAVPASVVRMLRPLRRIPVRST